MKYFIYFIKIYRKEEIKTNGNDNYGMLSSKNINLHYKYLNKNINDLLLSKSNLYNYSRNYIFDSDIGNSDNYKELSEIYFNKNNQTKINKSFSSNNINFSKSTGNYNNNLYSLSFNNNINCNNVENNEKLKNSP